MASDQNIQEKLLLQVLNNEIRIKYLETLLQWIVDHNDNIKPPTDDVIEQLKGSVSKEIDGKYSYLKKDK